MFKFLERMKQPENSTQTVSDYDLKVAVAGLFLEVINADFKVDPAEEEKLKTLLMQRFNLDENDVRDLIQFAKQDRAKRQDIWQFASRLKDRLPRERRIEVLTDLWRLIFADGRMDMFEDALIHKITELLGLDHSEMIEAKLKVKKEMNIE